MKAIFISCRENGVSKSRVCKEPLLHLSPRIVKARETVSDFHEFCRIGCGGLDGSGHNNLERLEHALRSMNLLLP
jgi:hypothetical protein